VLVNSVTERQAGRPTWRPSPKCVDLRVTCNLTTEFAPFALHDSGLMNWPPGDVSAEVLTGPEVDSGLATCRLTTATVPGCCRVRSSTSQDLGCREAVVLKILDRGGDDGVIVPDQGERDK